MFTAEREPSVSCAQKKSFRFHKKNVSSRVMKTAETFFCALHSYL